MQLVVVCLPWQLTEVKLHPQRVRVRSNRRGPLCAHLEPVTISTVHYSGSIESVAGYTSTVEIVFIPCDSKWGKRMEATFTWESLSSDTAC